MMIEVWTSQVTIYLFSKEELNAFGNASVGSVVPPGFVSVSAKGSLNIAYQRSQLRFLDAHKSPITQYFGVSVTADTNNLQNGQLTNQTAVGVFPQGSTQVRQEYWSFTWLDVLGSVSGLASALYTIYHFVWIHLVARCHWEMTPVQEWEKIV